MSFQCVAADSNKKFLPLAFSISHVFNGNRSRAKLGWAKSGDSKFIAWIADFANMSGLIFDLATHEAKPFPASKRCINRFGGVSAVRRI
jgi:hypothetical protein